MADYRILYKRFWSDPKIVQLAKAEMVDEIAVAVVSITGAMPNRNQAISGIYEIHRQGWECHGLNLQRTTKALEFFNAEMPSILEYDFENHIISVKNFCNYQTGYKPGVAIIPGLIGGFKETHKKAPLFWEGFSDKYNEKLRGLLPKLAETKEAYFVGKPSREEQVKFLEELIQLRDNFPSPNPKPDVSIKMRDEQRII